VVTVDVLVQSGALMLAAFHGVPPLPATEFSSVHACRKQK
jgi:hypothetical protein